MRRASSRTTEQIARRLGTHFPMWIGCGYPKSGTVWLCKLLATYLGVPYPQNYSLPIAMRSVVHAHWDFDPRLPSTAYIYRDGRDVMVSLYFHQMKQMEGGPHPQSAARLRARYRRIFGPSFDRKAVHHNLARFIEYEFEHPAYLGRTWSAHVRDWLGTPHPQVHPVSYEALKADTVSAFGDLMTRVLGHEADPRLVKLAEQRNDFALASGRVPGVEDRTNVMRKGIVGDWRTHFSRDSAEIFEQCAGSELRLLGYESDRSWVSALS